MMLEGVRVLVLVGCASAFVLPVSLSLFPHVDAPEGAIASVALSAPSVANPACVDRQSNNGLLVAVITAPTNKAAREAIRTSWAQDITTGLKGSVLFFLGTKELDASIADDIRKEPSDVVRIAVVEDTYENLVHKSMNVFWYAYENCYDAVMRVDDDTYLRVPNIVEFMNQVGNYDTVYGGAFIENAPVMKNPNGRWYAYDQYPHDFYPPFANGPAIFVGSHGIRHIYENRDKLTVIRTEDAALGVWLEPVKMDRVEMKSSFFRYIPEVDAVFQNPVTPEEMSAVHFGRLDTPQACQKEVKYSCRCSGSPYYSYEEIPACWESMGSEKYVPPHFYYTRSR